MDNSSAKQQPAAPARSKAKAASAPPLEPAANQRRGHPAHPPAPAGHDGPAHGRGDGDGPLPSPTLEPDTYQTPDELLSQFTKIIVAEEIDTTGSGAVDTVRVDGHCYDIRDWRVSKFNLLGRRIERDNAQVVKNNKELIKEFNRYDYASSKAWVCAGGVGSVLSCGLYLAKKRKTVPPGYFGHFISDKRHMLKPPGVHHLVSAADKWLADIPIEAADQDGTLVANTQAQRCRKFGDKVILQVPENHIAGGYRVGEHGTDALDQEFVLFSQGRHVLPESKYNGVCIIKLDQQQDTLGPLHVLYVREGFLGGVYERKTGVYKILYPGPPYLLHEQEYDSVELVQRTSAVFKLGPYEFATVKDGEVAGAYRKDGTFQILPPGHSYQLHSKDFSSVQVVRRTTQFTLGPYYYLTVRNGVEAGVYRKKDGFFQRLPAGHTYQLNQDDYREPLQVVRDAHICKIGPLTLVTVQDGFLNGAYRITDGAFVEFADPNQEYILHEKEFFGLSTVTKHSYTLQMFGPFKVITIREGEVGLFEKEGTIEIKEPGFYKVSAEYNIQESIPMQIFQEMLPDVQFRTKDGVQMDVKFTITWHVDQPLRAAKFNGSFAELRGLMTSRAMDALVRLCKMCSRGDLLPTKQDTAASTTTASSAAGEEQQDEKQREKDAADLHRHLCASLATACTDEIQAISQTSKLGVAIIGIAIEQFRLRDESILQDLEDMTKAELAKKAEKVRGELAIAKAGFEMAVREKKAKAEAEYMQARAKDEVIAREQRAKAEAALELDRAHFELQAREQRAVAEAKLAQTAEQAKGALDMAKAENDLLARRKLAEANAAIQLAEANAQAKVRQLRVQAETKARLEEAEAENRILKEQKATAAQIDSQRMIMEAEAEAKAIAAIAEAEYNKKMKECDAAAHMAPQEFELEKLRIQKEMQVEMMAGIGQAAWKYPDVYTGFLEQIQEVVKIAPHNAHYTMAGLVPTLLQTGPGSSGLAAHPNTAEGVQQPTRRKSGAIGCAAAGMDATGKLLFQDLLKRTQQGNAHNLASTTPCRL